jgi:hypothetical protein
MEKNMANPEFKFCDGFYDKPLSEEKQAARDRLWTFEMAKQIGLKYFVKTPGGYILKRPKNVDCIYDY